MLSSMSGQVHCYMQGSTIAAETTCQPRTAHVQTTTKRGDGLKSTLHGRVDKQICQALAICIPAHHTVPRSHRKDQHRQSQSDSDSPSVGLLAVVSLSLLDVSLPTLLPPQTPQHTDPESRDPPSSAAPCSPIDSMVPHWFFDTKNLCSAHCKQVLIHSRKDTTRVTYIHK